MEYFRTGQPIREFLTAKKLNRIVRTVNAVEGAYGMSGADGERPPLREGEIYVYFGQGANVSVAPYRAVAVSGAMVGSGELGTFDGDRCCSGGIVSSGAQLSAGGFGIAQDGFTSAELTSGGRFLRTVVHGITPAWVDVQNVTHTCVNAGGSGGALVSCDNGPGRIVGTPVSSGGQYLMVMIGAGGGGFTLAAVVTMPTSGGGVGTVKPVVIGSGGAITVASGGEIPVVFPFLDGYN